LIKTRLLIFIGLFLANSLYATQDQTYGLGGRTSGRVSGVTAEIENPFAALSNPAIVAAQPKPLFSFSAGQAATRYQALGPILVDSPQYRTRDSMPRFENYQPAEASWGLWSLGFTFPFRLPAYLDRRAGLGLTLSGPFGKIRSFQSGTPYDFTSLRYGTSDSQFKATIATGVEILPDRLYLGAGLSLFITAAGAADAYLVTDNPTGRFNLDVGLNTAGVAGLYGKFDLAGRPQNWGLVYRQAIHPTLQQSFEGRVQVMREAGPLRVPVLLSTTLYYEPHLFDFEWQTRLGPAKVALGVSWQLWSKYEPSYIVVETPDADQTTRRTQTPPLDLKNTLNPRISAEAPLFSERWIVSAGYQFRPSPLTDLSGPTNLMDSDTHVAGLSLSYVLGESAVLPLPLTLTAYGQYHFIQSRKVNKSQADFIGAPGYNFAGNAYTYGLTLETAL